MPITVNGQVPPVKPRNLREKLGDMRFMCVLPFIGVGLLASSAYERLRYGGEVHDISDTYGTPGVARQALNVTGRLLGRGWSAIVSIKDTCWIFNPMRGWSDDARRFAGFEPEEEADGPKR